MRSRRPEIRKTLMLMISLRQYQQGGSVRCLERVQGCKAPALIELGEFTWRSHCAWVSS
jgi:hypothetical protein